MAELIDKGAIFPNGVFALDENNPMESVGTLINRIANLQTTTEAEIRNKAIDEAMGKLAEEICVGCGSLKDHKCTYKGSNCRVSKIMLEKTMKVLEQLKEE